MYTKSKVGKFLLFLLHPKRSTALIFKQLICLICNIELGLATCIASNRNLILDLCLRISSLIGYL